jgi:hypothetical protein
MDSIRRFDPGVPDFDFHSAGKLTWPCQCSAALFIAAVIVPAGQESQTPPKPTITISTSLLRSGYSEGWVIFFRSFCIHDCERPEKPTISRSQMPARP